MLVVALVSVLSGGINRKAEMEMASDKATKLEAVLKGISRMAQDSDNYENGDAIARSAQYALQLLADYMAEDCEEMPAGVCEPLAA